MDQDLDLNTSGTLPDGTSASQAGGFGANASDFKRGFKQADNSRDPFLVEDPCSPNNESINQPSSTDGGFCGRPRGWQR